MGDGRVGDLMLLQKMCLLVTDPLIPNARRSRRSRRRRIKARYYHTRRLRTRFRLICSHTQTYVRTYVRTI
jgi:hypothetical protein